MFKEGDIVRLTRVLGLITPVKDAEGELFVVTHNGHKKPLNPAVLQDFKDRLKRDYSTSEDARFDLVERKDDRV